MHALPPRTAKPASRRAVRRGAGEDSPREHRAEVAGSVTRLHAQRIGRGRNQLSFHKVIRGATYRTDCEEFVSPEEEERELRVLHASPLREGIDAAREAAGAMHDA